MKMTTSVARSVGIVLLVLGSAVGTVSASDLSRPLTLVASPRLESAGFSETVLFVAPLPDGTHLGFIVNRPTAVPLAQVFPQHEPSRKVVDPVYFGGPVMPDVLFAVVRTPPEDTDDLLQLMPGVFMVMGGNAIDRIIESTPNDARYFAGLIVWEPGQLDEEISAGAWNVSPADAATVFSANPETLWKTLSAGGARLETRNGYRSPGEREIALASSGGEAARARSRM